MKQLSVRQAIRLALLSTACAPSASWAQAAMDKGLEEIIVTATRRSETVQDVPINIAALSGSQIKEQGFDELADILSFVPGINVVDRGGRQGNPIIVRGLNADALGSGDSTNSGGGTVATYLGEIPVYIDLKLNDLQRVEVLLGPQGTLYGAGTLGGAIRYIPNKPDFTEDLFEVRTEVFQYSESDSASGDIGFTFNMPITENFALRASADYRDDSGFIDYPFIVREPGVSEPDPDFNDPGAVAANLAPRDDADGEETVSGRVALRWAPFDRIDGTLTYYFQNSDIGGRRVSSARSTVPAGRYEAGFRVPEPAEIDNDLLALEVTADLGFAELTSATGLSNYKLAGQRDQTDLLISLEYSYEDFPTFTSFTSERVKEKAINQEVRLVSQSDGRLSWIAGFFYNEYEDAYLSGEFTPNYAAFIGSARADDLEYSEQVHTKLTESAVFGEIGFDITDRWSITVGGRYYDYELKSFSEVNFPLYDVSFVQPTLDQVFSTAFETGEDGGLNKGQSDKGTLFKFNTSYELSDSALLYATISEGYRTGNSNGLGTCEDFDPNAPVMQGVCALLPGQAFFPGGPGDVSDRDETQYGPDKTTNYELGLKTELLDGTLVLNGAVYFIDWTDPQVGSATVNAFVGITVNADGAESQGFELSGDWLVSDRLRVRGNFSYVQSELTMIAPDLIRTISTPGFGTAFEDGQPGDRLPGSPETQFSLFASYEQPMDSTDNILTYNFGYAYQGDVLSRAGGRGDGLTLDSFGMANASLVYDAGNWQAGLFVNNLFDEYAETGVRDTALSNQVINGAAVRRHYTYVSPPRSIGLRFNWRIQ